MIRHVILSLLLLPKLMAGATDTPPRVAPAPAWTTPAPPQDLQTNKADGAYRYHLSDCQYHLENNEQYTHLRVSIINESGVSNFSKLNFNYVPEYQQLLLHHITITRNGITQDRLKDARVETLRREQGMDQNLYDGELTALIILEDIRPGDTLSYAYTITGHNPVLGDIHHKFLTLGYDDPIDQIRYRVLWSPQKRKLRWLVHDNSKHQPRITGNESLNELLWEQKSAPRVTPEDNTPAWFHSYPYLEYSDCTDWTRFRDWALPLYVRQEPLPPEAARVVEDIRSKYPDEETRITATLNWVQTHIRYLGSFFGEHTHEPYPLSDIWRRQFGDCKDKTMLTVAMLRHLGLDAAPALVNSSLSRAIHQSLPGPALFNHVIVHLRWQNEDYYLDPTDTYQRGPLKTLSIPDYGHVFQIRPQITALTPVGPRNLQASRTVTRETYKVDDLHGSATLTVQTTATGDDAASLRGYFAATSRDEITEEYRKFYARHFHDIESTGTIEIEDNESNNTVTFHENYRIPEFWSEDETNKRWHAFVNASFIQSNLIFPEKQKRKHPWALRFPNHVQQHIRVELPQPWAMPKNKVDIKHPAFTYQSTTEANNNIITLSYEYHALNHHVLATDFNDFAKSMTKVNEDLSTEIWHYNGIHQASASPSTPEKPKSNTLLASLIIIGGSGSGFMLGLFMSLLLWFWNPPARTPLTDQYRGIAGWLVLPMLGLILSPLIMIRDILSPLVDTTEMVSSLNTLDGFSIWHVHFTATYFRNGFCLASCLLLLTLFFKQRTSFPWLFIVCSALILLSDISLLIIEQFLPNLAEPSETPRAITRSALSLLVWGSYMMASDRVKATFTTRRTQAPAFHSPPPIPALPTAPPNAVIPPPIHMPPPAPGWNEPQS